VTTTSITKENELFDKVPPSQYAKNLAIGGEKSAWELGAEKADTWKT
jgi:hypothetical protein